MEYLEEVAIGIAKQLANKELVVNRDAKKPLPQKAFEFALKFNWVKDQIFNRAKGQVMKLTGGLYPAPLKILEVS